jgi:hypothetical protein
MMLCNEAVAFRGNERGAGMSSAGVGCVCVWGGGGLNRLLCAPAPSAAHLGSSPGPSPSPSPLPMPSLQANELCMPFCSDCVQDILCVRVCGECGRECKLGPRCVGLEFVVDRPSTFTVLWADTRTHGVLYPVYSNKMF